MFMMSLGAFACSTRPAHAAEDLPKPQVDLPPAQSGDIRTAVFAGGCFWCTEAVFEQLNGVIDVTSGYAGGSKDTATYEQVGSGRTGHAESIRITYDPAKITYGELLRVFFTAHDPTTKDRQGPDEGTQYRSAIFYDSDEQKRVAEAYIKQLNDAKAFSDPIVTTVEPLNGFFPAEKYHQDFAAEHPDHPYILRFAVPKVQKVKSHFKDDLKQPATARSR